MSARVPVVSDILPGTPKAGTGDEARAAYSFVEDVRLDAAFFSTSVAGAQADLLQLQSGALGALVAKNEQNILPGVRAVEQSARLAGIALNHYANRVDSIHRRADRLRLNAESALSRIGRAMAEIEEICLAILVPFAYAWNQLPTPLMPEPHLRPGVAPADADEQEVIVNLLRQVHETRWRNSVVGWQSDVDGIATARRSWVDLIEERRYAEDTLINALSDTPLGQLITVGARISGGRKRAIAVGLTGELGGVPSVADALNTGHPLLAGLFPGSDGSGVWESPPDPEDVVTWWAALSQPEQEELIRTVPYVIGNLPGLPAWARDRANKLSLEFYRANPQLLGPEQLKLVAEVQRILDREAEQHVPNPPIQLISFSLRETVPMVAVGYGEIDSASHLSWMAFGMDNDAQNGIKTADTVSRNLLQEQQLMSVRDATSSPATVGWLGYDTPDKSLSGEVLNSESALEGSKRLASELDGIAALRGVSDVGMPITNVVAHSYGATMVAIALTLIKVPVDSFVMLGGAGLDLDLVPSLRVLNVKNVTNGQKGVFATTAQSDRVAPTGAAWAGRGLVDANAKSILGWERKVPVLGGAVSFPSDGDPSLGHLGTTGHPLIGNQSQPPLGVGDVGYGDIGSQSLFITAQITMQEIGPETLKKLAVTAGEDVRVLVDSESGRKTFLRVPPREAAQR